MSDILIDTGSVPPVRELWVWIGHYADGSEGILGVELPLVGNLRHMPLMNTGRESAERLVTIAKRIQDESQDFGLPIMRIELRQFRAVTV